MATISKSHQPTCSIKEGTWEDFREAVKAVNAELFHIIEEINPDKKYKLLEVTYRYGEKITDFGTICLPDKEGQSLRLEDVRLPDRYREQLGYGPTPLILQLTRGSEVFVDTGERIIPLNIFIPGDLYGLFEAIIPLTACSIAPCWSVTAGARSVFLSAKVSDAIGHKRLRAEFGVEAKPPTRLSDQWDVIKTIGNRSNPDSPWTCKVLIFTKAWLQKRNDDLGWVLFRNYLLTKSWLQSKYMRSKVEWSIMREAFAAAVRDRNLKPGPYILDTVIHNIFLANGDIPGFIPADTQELLLPSRSIEYAYENIYMLKEYAAIVMHPWRLGEMNNTCSIYYSLAYPTMLEGTPAIRHAPSIISEMRMIRMLMHTLEKVSEKLGGIPHETIKNISFEYFHTEEDKFKELNNSKKLMESDPNLGKCIQRFPGKIFPYQGPFFRGCVRITKKS